MSSRREFDEAERSVGITAFVSPDAPGFAAVSKARYSDFLVHEGTIHITVLYQMHFLHALCAFLELFLVIDFTAVMTHCQQIHNIFHLLPIHSRRGG